ncbi:PRC-barrel domain-containing protein [Propionibacteriaceae bacterium G57]|uniref:PRC-barrel domain-containing protein n=1 Tax=Aestuariimicrobium sp. G57 TaxID=3418485 RepID=UPI003DA74FCF
MTDINLDEYYDAVVVDSDGEKVGGVGQVFLDEQTGQPSWVTVRTGLFGLKESFVPLVDARLEGGALHVAFTKDFIKEAPRQDPDTPMTVAEEDALQAYYGTEDEPDKIASADAAAGEPAPTAADLYAGQSVRAAEDTTPAATTPDDTEPDDEVSAVGNETPADETPADEVPADDDETPTPTPPAQVPSSEHKDWVEPEKHVYGFQTNFAEETEDDLLEDELTDEPVEDAERHVTFDRED